MSIRSGDTELTLEHVISINKDMDIVLRKWQEKNLALQSQLTLANQKIEKLVKALEEYARLGNLDYEIGGQVIGFGISPVFDSEKLRRDKPVAFGKLARQTLKEVSEMGEGK